MSEETGIFARESDYLDRYVQFGEAQGRVISVSFPGEPPADAGEDHPLLDRLDAYFEGASEGFADVTVALTVPTDRRAVLEVVREIPHGGNADCRQVTRAAGLDPDDEADRRLVRQALADNPAPLLIPDHRIRDAPSAAPPAVEQRLRSLENL
ncbi:cysteine methyltransferase [Halobacteriales archaeon QS_5_68_33]|nr:MAG: cysteine methyltransferase [Halobacteriales archaeon QS_5_68_33]